MELKHPRSILCVPGHRADFAAKCRSYGADQILWDLEDSVPEAQKERAREVVSEHLAAGDAARVNASPPRLGDASDLERDLEMLRAAAVPDVWVWAAKTWGPPHLAHIAGRLPLARQRVCALLEEPWPLVHLSRFAEWTFSALAFGKHDYLAAAGLSPWQTAAIDHAAAQVALAAMARGVPCYMAPSYELDPVLVMDDAEHARELGFTGMGCIRPAHVEIVNHVFGPCDEDVVRAGSLLAAAEANPDPAVFRTAGGDLVSPPALAWARRVLG